jgi:hypothetical protein
VIRFFPARSNGMQVDVLDLKFLEKKGEEACAWEAER